MKKYIFAILLLSTFYFLFSGIAVFAASSDLSCAKNENAYPWCKAAEKGLGGTGGLVARFYEIALAMVGVTAFGVMVYGGILYTVSRGNASTQQDAIGWVTAAALGVVLLLAAYLLLYIINPELTKLTDPAQSIKKVEFKFDPKSPAFQSSIHNYFIDKCPTAWETAPNTSCDNLNKQKQNPPYYRPNAPQVCCKMIGDW